MKTTLVKKTLFIAVLAAILICLGCGGPPRNNGGDTNANAVDTKKADSGETKTTSSTCTAADNAQIVSQIRIFIDEDPALRPHRAHINYSTKYCKVTLRGWIDSWANFQKLYEKIHNAEGVRSIDIKGFSLGPPPQATPGGAAEQCPAGTKPCGELCVPTDEDCTIQIND